MRSELAVLLAFLVLTPSLSGCFGEEEDSIGSRDLVVEPEILTGAEFQVVEFTAKRAMSVHIPYFVIDAETGFVTISIHS